MTAASHLQRLLRSSGIYAVGNALNRLGGFLLLPLYTRYLSAAEYGSLELLYATSSVIGGVLSVGIASATMRFYFEYDKPAEQHAVVTTNLFASLAITLIGSTLAWLVAVPFFYKVFPESVPTWALALILLTTCLELSTEILLAYIRARDLALMFVGFSIVKLLVQCGANIYLVRFASAGMPGVLIGNFMAVGIEWLLLAAYTLKHCGMAFQLDKLIPVLKYCFPLLLTTIVGVLQGSFDRFLAGTYIGLSALGVYAVAQKFARVIVDFVGIPFGLAYGAFRFNMMKAQGAERVQADIVLYLVCVLSVIGLAMIYAIDDVLRLMTAPQYWDAGKMMPLLVTGAILSVVTGPLQTGILYSKQTKAIFYLSILGALAGAVFAVGFSTLFGVFGLAFGVAATNAVVVVATARVGHRYLPAAYPLRRIATLCVLWAFFTMAPAGLANIGHAPSMPAKAALWLAFVACLFLLRIMPLALLREAAARLRRG